MDPSALKTPSAILKIIEVVLTIICIIMSQVTTFFTFGLLPRTFFCSGVLLMSAVVSALIFITYLIDSEKHIQRSPLEIMINAVLAIFMLSAGGVTIDTSINYGITTTTALNTERAVGALAIINAVAYGIDTYFAVKRRTE